MLVMMVGGGYKVDGSAVPPDQGPARREFPLSTVILHEAVNRRRLFPNTIPTVSFLARVHVSYISGALGHVCT
jgi:hypothetical protein